MCNVVEYRQLASEYRRLAALVTGTADKTALELFAIGWDKIANNREAMLHNEDQSKPACLIEAAAGLTIGPIPA